MSHAIAMSETPVANRVIPVLVVCLHAVALAFILWGHFLDVTPPPKPPGMEVELVFAPPVDEQDATEDAVEEPQPIPDPPKKPETKPPDVKPKPVDPPPVVPPPKPVVVEKPVVKPPPKPVVAEKPVVKPPPKKKWRATSIEDMRRRVAQNNPPPARPRVNVNDIANALSTAASSVTISHPAPHRPVGSPRSTIREADFESAVAGVVGQYWNQNFAASELTGAGREVLVKFTIAPNGTIVGARISKFSHVLAVDRRVAQALQRIKAKGFPAPSKYGIQSATYEVEVRFGVKE
jgi:TonB family protein